MARPSNSVSHCSSSSRNRAAPRDVHPNTHRESRGDRPPDHQGSPHARRGGRLRVLNGGRRRTMAGHGRCDRVHRKGPRGRFILADRSDHGRGRNDARRGHSSGLWLSRRKRPLRRSLPRLQHRVHRPEPRGHGQVGGQDHLQGPGKEGGYADLPRLGRSHRRDRRGSGNSGDHRVPGHRQSFGRRRRPGNAHRRR